MPAAVAPRQLLDFRRDVDELLERFFGHRRSPDSRAANRLPIECYVEGGNLIVLADVPGIDPKQIEVTVEGDVLVVRGKREARRDEEHRNFISRELRYGAFERRISIPPGIEPESVTARHSNGVLELTIPIPKESACRVRVQMED